MGRVVLFLFLMALIELVQVILFGVGHEGLDLETLDILFVSLVLLGLELLHGLGHQVNPDETGLDLLGLDGDVVEALDHLGVDGGQLLPVEEGHIFRHLLIYLILCEVLAASVGVGEGEGEGEVGAGFLLGALEVGLAEDVVEALEGGAAALQAQQHHPPQPHFEGADRLVAEEQVRIHIDIDDLVGGEPLLVQGDRDVGLLDLQEHVPVERLDLHLPLGLRVHVALDHQELLLPHQRRHHLLMHVDVPQRYNNLVVHLRLEALRVVGQERTRQSLRQVERDRELVQTRLYPIVERVQSLVHQRNLLRAVIVVLLYDAFEGAGFDFADDLDVEGVGVEALFDLEVDFPFHLGAAPELQMVQLYAHLPKRVLRRVRAQTLVPHFLNF
mmetsp:Transcript_27395/g.26466  ORF Transcript_27395/g.26466 Transcript_27395/m.26466 type:complete len:386 (+) Transcript_27395:243-1400(+)